MTKSRLHTEEMPAYLDKEVSKEEQDRFGHTHLAAALRGLVEDDKHQTPYSIGLLGKWGTGKSTVKGLYLNHLHNDETKDSDGVKRRDRIYTITFNAWKYGGENDIRKSLFRHIFLEIGGTHDEADRHLFKTVASTEFQKKPIKEIFAEFVDQYAFGLLIVVLFGILFFVLSVFLAWAIGIEDPLTSSAAILASAGVVTVLAQKFFSSLTVLSARAPVQIISQPSQTIEEFEHLFIDQIRKFKKGRVVSGRGKNARRIVVFIDDLDRLTADEMVSGLDGIRSLIEMASQEMPDGIGIVFVISCDEERVADALSKRRAYAAELPAAVSNIQDARRYLDRIFQFRLEIPPFPKRDMRNFASSLLEKEFPALSADLTARDIDTQELVDRIIHPGVQSPRNAIQIMNSFAQSWWLGVLRERGAIGTEKPGGLGEGVITTHPLTLGIVCVIKTDFPDFCHALQRRPRIFEHFIDRFIRPEPLETLPSEIREELTYFLATEPETGRWEIKPEHRGLRQFMSHIQDVRRPYSLQPFLALSQDPVSRRHGDKAVPIEEALRTSDVAALLDAVGLTGSAEPFPPDFGELLADLIDDLRAETPTIQDNVAFTVSQIDDRVPEKDRRRVLGLVVRRAADSEGLRWRVGPSKLRRLTSYADADELRAVGRSLIDDIAAETSNVLLPSLEAPSIREGRSLVEAVADLVLEVMQNVDLPPQAQTRFGDWLLSRTVKISGQSEQIPLSWLEQKLSAHQDIALPLIHDEYPRIVYEELNREEPETLDLDAVTARVGTVFDGLFERGTQTRTKLWAYLKDFSCLPQASLAELAFTKFAKWHGDADADAADVVFTALGARLVHYEEDAEKWPLDEEESLRNTFNDLAEALESFGVDSIAHMVGLSQQWSKEPERSQSATRLYSVLAEVDPEQWSVLNQEWTKRLFKDLPEKCQRALFAAANQDDAPQALRTGLASTIEPLRGATELDSHQVEAFSRMMHVLDAAILQASPFAEQLSQFIDDLVNLVTQNPGAFIVSKVRVLAGNLHKIPAAKAQQLLNAFVQLQPQPEILAGVYDTLSAVWPVPATEGGLDFAAQKLFDSGTDALTNLGHSDDAVDLLKSLDNLHTRTRLEQSANQDHLVGCGYELWSKAPDTAEAIWRKYPEAKRSSEQLAKLANQAHSVTTGETGNSDRLLAALLHEIGCTSSEDVEATTGNLLATPPQETEESSDPILAVWASAVAQHDPQILVDTLVNENITDEQSARLYYRILENLEQLSSDHFLTIMRATLPAQEGREKTADAIVRCLGDVAAQIFGTGEEKRSLCDAVLAVFADVPNRERKAELARICTEFGLKNVIVDGGYKQKLPEDDIEIIEQFTGKITS